MRAQLAAYFAGKLLTFDMPLAPQGTPFQQSVWHQLRQIPYGDTASYIELARRLGNPSAMRAVGAANGANPIAIIVPCHRVIGHDGKLVGFGGGLAGQALAARSRAPSRAGAAARAAPVTPNPLASHQQPCMRLRISASCRLSSGVVSLNDFVNL